MLLGAAGPGLLLGAVVLAAPAAAALSVGVAVDLPTPVIEGRSRVPGSITVANFSSGAQASGAMTIDEITVVPSCGSAFHCDNAATFDPGALVFRSPVGAAGTACAGVVFTRVSINAAAGKQRWVPATPVHLAPPSPSDDLDTCRIEFNASVMRMPWVDAAPLTPGAQTATEVVVKVSHAAASPVTVRDMTLTTVTPVGTLRVVTSPALPSQILINGVPADTWGVWTRLPVGTYSVAFTRVAGYTEPPPQTVTVSQGATTTVTGTFVERGWLRVETNPALPATIAVEGVVRDDWGVWTDLPVGAHQVCFGLVAGYSPPPCQTANLTAGNLTSVTGNYTRDPAGPAPSGHGFLRVVTSPPVPSQITVDDTPRDTWGLWMKLHPGTHTVRFGRVPGYSAPSMAVVNVSVGSTTTVTASFTPRGVLRVVTSPAVPATILVNGVVRNDWGVWTDLPAGIQTVCFGAVAGYVSPPCVDINIPGGVVGTVTGHFTPAP